MELRPIHHSMLTIELQRRFRRRLRGILRREAITAVIEKVYSFWFCRSKHRNPIPDVHFALITSGISARGTTRLVCRTVTGFAVDCSSCSRNNSSENHLKEDSPAAEQELDFAAEIKKKHSRRDCKCRSQRKVRPDCSIRSVVLVEQVSGSL